MADSVEYRAANGYANLLLARGQDPAAVDELVPQNSWCLSLLSTCCSHFENISTLWQRDGTFCSKLGRKLEATFKSLCCTCFVLANAVNEQKTIFFKQSGVVYLFLLLSLTVVVNLVVPLRSIEVPVAGKIQKYFILICIILALTKMLYLCLFADPRPRVDYSSNALMRVFYQGGLYLFGFSSFGYSIATVIDNITCGRPVEATVNTMKALYIVAQILFLIRFYRARIPDSTFCIQIVLAHLLGTNLTLWFWTLCSEEMREPTNGTSCTSYPIPLGESKRYFSPLFVEYLLIAASLLYQMWQDLLPMDTGTVSHCRTCACQLYVAENGEAEQRPNEGGVAAVMRETFSGSLGLGTCSGFCFAVLFVILVIASSASGDDHQIYHLAYSAGIIALYITQLFACYIILLSVQSLAWDSERASVDHEDALLYISLVGSLLWQGFHLYSLMLTDIDSRFETRKLAREHVRHIDIAADALAMVQYVFQTVTLVRLRQHQRTPGRSTTWLCQCVLFLVATNLGIWFEDSFFIEIIISTPGEHYSSIQKNLEPVGYILHPLNIFFRFHSAVCSLIAWSMFRPRG